MILFNSVSNAQKRISVSQLNGWQVFNSRNGNNWKIKWNQRTGTPAMIYGAKTTPYSNSTEQTARDFLTTNSSFIGITNNTANLHFKKSTNFNGIKSIIFEQYYNNTPVYNATYSVSFNNTNQIVMMSGHYFNNINVNTSPMLNKIQALNIVVQVNNLMTPTAQEVSSRLVIYPYLTDYVLAWEIILNYNDLEGYKSIINASSGDILEFNSSTLSATSTGKANVYPIDPINSSLLNNQTLYRLDYGTWYVKGKYVDVNTDLGSRATSKQRQFLYQPSSYHFDEANVYWHIDNFANT